MAIEAGHDGADGDATVADDTRAGVEAHLTRTAALVADTEVILQGQVLGEVGAQAVVTGNHRHGQAATGEVGGVAVADADRRVDEHARSLIGSILQHADAVGEVADDRGGRLGQRAGRAEQVLVDAVILVTILVIRLPGRRPAAAGEARDVRTVLRAAGVVVQHQRRVDLVARRVELLRHGLMVADTGIVAPGDHVAAVVQGGNAAVGVAVAGGAGAVVDQHLAADLDAGSGVALGHDRPTAETRVVADPADHEIAVAQHRHVGVGLVVGCVAVDLELAAARGAVGVHQPRLHAPVAAVLAFRMPHHHVATVVEPGQLRERLVAGNMGVDRERRTLGDAIDVVVLYAHAIAVAVGVLVVGVGDDEGAAVQAKDLGLELVMPSRGVDQELTAHRLSVGAVALRVDAVERSILVIGIPRHDETAGGKPGSAEQRVAVLVARRVGVDLELGSDGRAVDVVALAEHAVAAAVLAAGLPDHHVLTAVATLQGGDDRLDLVAGGVGVDALLLIQQRHGAVGLGGDVDRHHARRALAAVAVGYHHGHLAAGGGVAGAVAVGQVLDHRFDGFGARVGVELQHQIGAVLAVADDAADGRAGVGHHTGAGIEADLAGAAALVANGEVVLLECDGVEGLRGTVAGDDADVHTATVEVGGIRVHHPHARIEELRCRVDDVFIEADRVVQIDQFRRSLAGDAARRAEHLLEDTVAAVAVALLVIAHPDGDEVVAGERGDVRVVLVVGGIAVEREGAVHLVAIGVEFLGIDAVAAVARAGVAVPAHHEAAALQRGDMRPLAVVGIEVAAADGEFAADGHAGSGIELATDVANGLVNPNDNDMAIGQNGDIGIGLAAAGGGIDQKFAANLGAG